MGAEYEVYLYSNTGAQLACLTKKITRLTWNRVQNDVGSFSITLSDEKEPVDRSLFQLNGRVLILRKPEPFGMARLEMMGFIRGEDFATDEKGVTRFTWHGPDQNDLLQTRCGFPWHPYIAGAWQVSMQRYIDTLMRELVEDNLGAGSSNESARDLATSNTAGLTIAVESSAIATACTTAGMITYEYGGKNLLRVCQELHDASHTYVAGGSTVAVPVYFDMCLDSDTSVTFRVRTTRWGMNHRADSGQPVFIGLPYGNLRMPRWENDRTKEINAGLGLYYAGSYSSSSWKLDSTRVNEAPLNRREGAGTTSDDTGAVANVVINEGKTKPRFSGIIQDTPTCRYGIDWGLGDELSIDYLGKQYSVLVSGINVDFYGGYEKLEPTMEVLDA